MLAQGGLAQPSLAAIPAGGAEAQTIAMEVFHNFSVILDPIFTVEGLEPVYDYPLPDRTMWGDYGLRANRAMNSLQARNPLRIGRHGK